MTEVSNHQLVNRHLLRMRMVAALFLASQAVAAALVLTLEQRRPAGLSPLSVTLAALGVGLWLTFTADRHSRRLLARVKGSFADHGDEARLLRHHRMAFTLVLARLEVVTLFAMTAAVWGAGPVFALPLLLAVTALMALAWPTRRKTLLLLERARDLRIED